RAPEVRKAQDGVLEFLLINHPLDCPVCDKGGECPLQDQTLHFGPGESRFVEEKRHFEKPISISPLVTLDRERCILCDRCTRFSKEVAGDPLIHFIDRGNETQVNTFPSHPFASYFSGNTVQICPVGALTATPYRFKSRPWDLETVDSTCMSCSVGCRVEVQSSQNAITRYLGIDSDPTNHSWLCDRGRFDFESINSDDRLVAPQIRKDGELVEASWGEALAAAAQGIADVKATHGPGAVAVLGGARLANEDAYAWAKLAKSVIGTDSVDAQMGDGLPADCVVGLPGATIDEACRAAALIVLAGDVKEELPVLYLRLRDAALYDGLPIIELAPRSTALTSLSAASIGYRPGESAEVIAALLATAEPVADVGGVAVVALKAARAALSKAREERDGEVVVLLGRPSLAESGESIAAAAGEVRRVLPGARFLVGLRRGNVRGALDLGLAPGLLPGRIGLEDGREWFTTQWGSVADGGGLDTAGILTAAAEGRVHALVLLGADPLADFPDRELARRALSSVSVLLAIDCFVTGSSAQATVVLPAAGYAERRGTTTNLEGRITRVGEKVVPRGTAWPDWMIAVELADALGADLGVETIDGLWDEIERVAPSHRGITRPLLAAPGRVDGIVVGRQLADPAVGARTSAEVAERDPSAMEHPATVLDGASRSVGLRIEGGFTVTPVVLRTSSEVPEPSGPEEETKPSGDAEQKDVDVAQAPADTVPEPVLAAAEPTEAVPDVRPWTGPKTPYATPVLDAYSLRLVATRALYDESVSIQHSPSLSGLARQVAVRLHPGELERIGVGNGDRVRVSSNRTSLTLEAIADAGVPRGSAAIEFNLPGPGAADLIDSALPVTDVRVETT
ncbi:MAG TPA: molybdopterin-dependent oxidoreductase, partial [Acidimicrobiales bacterium]|nr:molybdopterin-dependent oxidoreductase [Acidimicrobiales bacterium]